MATRREYDSSSTPSIRWSWPTDWLRLRLGGRAPLPRGVQPPSAPEVFPAAASQRTQRIRLGHGIVHSPPTTPARSAWSTLTSSATAAPSWAWGGIERHRAAPVCLVPCACALGGGRHALLDADVLRGGLKYHGTSSTPLPTRAAPPAAAPAVVGGVQPAETIEMAAGAPGALGFQFVSADAAVAWVVPTTTLYVKRLTACAIPDQPEHRRRQHVHVRRDRRAAQVWPTAPRSSSSPCASTPRSVEPGMVSSGRGRMKATPSGQRAERRPHRLLETIRASCAA